jgi:WD40 repeat protein/CHAT domain-containing protein/tetratricopeptide (TPR) repeat protein
MWWKRVRPLGAVWLVVLTATGLPAWGQQAAKIRVVPNIPHYAQFYTAMYSPDGAYMASSSFDNNVKIWDAASGQLLHTLAGHADVVESMAFSPDNTRLVTASRDKTIKIWDIATGTVLHDIGGHTQHVNSVAYFPDGLRFLSGSGDKTVKIWDGRSGQLLRSLEGHPDPVHTVAISPDGRLIASGGQWGKLKIWDAASGDRVRELPGHFREGYQEIIHSVAFSSDGSSLATAGWDKTIRLWDVGSGTLLRTLHGHVGPVNVATFSQDGTRLFSGSSDTTIKMWDAKTGALLRTLPGHMHTVKSLVLSRDGQRMLSGSFDNTLKLWEVTTGRQLRVVEANSGLGITSLAYSPDGERLWTGNGDAVLRQWNATTGELVQTHTEHTGTIASIAVSADGTKILSASGDNTIKLWDGASGQLLRTLDGHSRSANSVAFSPDGNRILSAGLDNTIKLWDTSTGKLLRTAEGRYPVAFSPDGKRVAYVGLDKTIGLWELWADADQHNPAPMGTLGVRLEDLTAEEVSVLGVAGRHAKVTSVANFGAAALAGISAGDIIVSVDGMAVEGGARLATEVRGRTPGTYVRIGILRGGEHREVQVKLEQIATLGRLIHKFQGEARSLAFSFDGTVLVAGDDKGARLLHWPSRRVLHTLTNGRTNGWPGAIAYSSDATRILTSFGNTITLWDAKTGQALRSFEHGHTGRVSALTFSPNGKRFASGNADTTVRIWSVASETPLATLLGTERTRWIAVSPAGFYAASREHSDLLGLVVAAKHVPIAQVEVHLHRPDLLKELFADDPQGKHKAAEVAINLEETVRSGAPPRLEFLANRIQKIDRMLRLAVRLTDMGGGIGLKTDWRVNGATLVQSPIKSSLKGPSRGRWLVQSQTLNINPSVTNDIEVIAYNHTGKMATPPVRLSIAPWVPGGALGDFAERGRQISELMKTGQYREALSKAQQDLMLTQQDGEDHLHVSRSLSLLGELNSALGRYTEAEKHYMRALKIRTNALSRNHLDMAEILNNVGDLYYIQARYKAAEVHHHRALAIREQVLNHDHPDVAQSLASLASAIMAQGRYGDVEWLLERSLSIRERVQGSGRADTAQSLNLLGILRNGQGRYADAEKLLDQAIAVVEQYVGSDHPKLAEILNNQGHLLTSLARYGEATQLYKRALAISEKTLGPEHLEIAQSLGGLATVALAETRSDEAELLCNRAIQLGERALGPQHPFVGRNLTMLAGFYSWVGRYSEAEPLLKRAVGIAEKTYGAEHREVASALMSLGYLYDRQERIGEAASMYRRALTVLEKALGPEHREVSDPLQSVANSWARWGYHAEAEPLYRRAVAIREKALGPDHPDVGDILLTLANFLSDLGRNAEAEPLSARGLAIVEKAYHADHPAVAKGLGSLGNIYSHQRRFAEADSLLQRSLRIEEKMLRPNHPEIASALWALAVMNAKRGDVQEALAYQRRASALLVRRIEVSGGGGEENRLERTRGYGYFRFHAALANLANDRETLFDESFVMAQWGVQTAAGEALAQMSARLAGGGGALAEALRNRDELLRQQQDAHANLNRELVAGDVLSANRVRDLIVAVDGRLGSLEQRLTKEFPDFARFASPQPVDVAAARASLRENEVLIAFLQASTYVTAQEDAFAWVLTKTSSRWAKLALDPSQISEHVNALRCGLDTTLWYNEKTKERCRALLKAEPVKDTSTNVDVLPFDAPRAHALYQALLQPFADLIAGKHLIIVPDEFLATLPFGVLLTAPPVVTDALDLASYRNYAWLGIEQPITVLPSVSSLKSLRQFAKRSRASRPYLGVGNPLLDGPQGDQRWGAYHKQQAQLAREKRCGAPAPSSQVAEFRARQPTEFVALFRNAKVDIEQVRSLEALPESADELCDVGQSLGASEDDILLGARATEDAVKSLSETGRLAEFAILHFATHGAMSGQIKGAAEPGLILTPPATGMVDARKLQRDDGFLTASEIAALKLDADWVILSACNTASGALRSGEALSGIARAFFFAGARALLVSHWEIGSEAAVKLTTRAISELKSGQATGRSEALSRSMRHLLMNGAPIEAHPSVWAPFILVGEGAH